MKTIAAAAISAGLLLALPSSVLAHQAGDIILRVGAHVVDPQSDNGTLADGALSVDVASDLRPTIAAEWMWTDQLGIELLASLPFEHDIRLNGVDAGSTRHLPPTLSVQWHFNPSGTVQPYLGAGINYTVFGEERSRGPIAGADLELDSSWGLAAHAGIDFVLNDKWMLGVDVRAIDIDTDVRVDGARVGTVNIDPLVYGVYVGYRF
jgi:outer membrane protein